MACKELVVVLSEYLDGSLPPDDRRRLEAHLDECPYCVNYVVQMKETIDAMGGVSLEALAPERARGGARGVPRLARPQWSRLLS